MDTVKVIEVVETTLLRRGNGKETPIRIITQYWDREGNLLAEIDPSPDENRQIEYLSESMSIAIKQLEEFIRAPGMGKNLREIVERMRGRLKKQYSGGGYER